MDGAQRKGNWSLKELETLLQQKRHALSERRASSFLSAEVDLRRRLMSRAQEDANLTKPPKSPEGWSGANGQDRYFRSMTIVPLDGSQHWLLPAGHPAQKGLGATVTIRGNGHNRGRRWRDALLLLIEIMAVVGLLAAVGLTYLHLRPLKGETQAIVSVTATAILMATPALAVPTLAEGLPMTDASVQAPPTEAFPTATPTPVVTAELAPTGTALLSTAPLPTAALVLPGGRPTTRGTAPRVVGPPTATSAPPQVMSEVDDGPAMAAATATVTAVVTATTAPTDTAIAIPQTPAHGWHDAL